MKRAPHPARRDIVPDSLRKRRVEIRGLAQPVESEGSGFLKQAFDAIFRKIPKRLIKLGLSREPRLVARFNAPLKVFNVSAVQAKLGANGARILRILRVGMRVIMITIQLAKVVKLGVDEDVELTDLNLPAGTAGDAYDRTHGEIAVLDATEEEELAYDLAEANGVDLPIDQPVLTF